MKSATALWAKIGTVITAMTITVLMPFEAFAQTNVSPFELKAKLDKAITTIGNYVTADDTALIFLVGTIAAAIFLVGRKGGERRKSMKSALVFWMGVGIAYVGYLIINWLWGMTVGGGVVDFTKNTADQASKNLPFGLQTIGYFIFIGLIAWLLFKYAGKIWDGVWSLYSKLKDWKKETKADIEKGEASFGVALAGALLTAAAINAAGAWIPHWIPHWICIAGGLYTVVFEWTGLKRGRDEMKILEFSDGRWRCIAPVQNRYPSGHPQAGAIILLKNGQPKTHRCNLINGKDATKCSCGASKTWGCSCGYTDIPSTKDHCPGCKSLRAVRSAGTTSSGSTSTTASTSTPSLDTHSRYANDDLF